MPLLAFDPNQGPFPPPALPGFLGITSPSVICLAAAQEAVPIASYRPTQVKKMITGSGRATKDQVQRAIQREFGLADPPQPPDVADALAVALCHFYTTGVPQSAPCGDEG